MNKNLEKTNIKQENKKILIWYSNQNEEWLQKLLLNLRKIPDKAEKIGFLNVEQVGNDAKQKDLIAKKLKNAEMVIILISKEFLESKFIDNNYLVDILRAAELKGLSNPILK